MAGAALKAGDTADKDVYLKMSGGYGTEFLVPGEPDDGQPGVLLVQKGDVVSKGAVARHARAVENAKRMSKATRGGSRGRKAAGDGDGDGGTPPAE